MERISRNRIAPAASQWLVFPLVLGGAVAASMKGIANGTEAGVAILLPQLAAVALIALLEHVYPLHRSWNRPRRDIRVDATHTVSIAIMVGLVTPFVLAAGVTVAAWLSSRLGTGLWPSEWPLLAQAALALVVGELPGYAVHRLEHEWDGLWRFHATHHSAPRLYWLNAGRFHPIDTLLTFVPSVGLLVVLGCGAPVLALFTLVTAVHGIFQHANLQLRLGPLNHFFSMAELHRWHHSKTMGEANHNYGQTVILWDTLLGTRFLPSDREPPEAIGIPDLPNFPMTWWAQIRSPFRWAKIRSESAASCAEEVLDRPSLKGDAIKLHRLLLVLAAISFAVRASAQDLKPGLWEVTNKVHSAGGEMDEAAAEMQQQMASMPPEQRKMLEEMMAKQGVKMGAGGPGEMTARICMTKEMIERNQAPAQQGNCKTTTEPRTGNTMKMTFACTDPPSSGEGQYTIVSPEAFATKLVVRSAAQGKPATTSMDGSGKWLAADCGNIEPMRPPPTK